VLLAVGLPTLSIAKGLEVTLWTTNTVGDARLAATTTTTSKKVLSPLSSRPSTVAVP
jgi:hypothetical protein